nr:immunoglobulin light chain junction region [Macaca mulatta]MOX69612.1 immunoglobulin light chain junction region [Macaca mulatta]MOX72744.1 immunoglobulin light chain junction region [Macaca mulatta]MOX74212.1 immunoglobulin light chain junction region [Macaca mulatta]
DYYCQSADDDYNVLF